LIPFTFLFNKFSIFFSYAAKTFSLQKKFEKKCTIQPELYAPFNRNYAPFNRNYAPFNHATELFTQLSLRFTPFIGKPEMSHDLRND